MFLTFLCVDIAILNHFDGDSCDPSTYTSTDTFYLGCNPTLKRTVYDGEMTYSVNVQCLVDDSTSRRKLSELTIDDLAATGVIPADGKSYAVQE